MACRRFLAYVPCRSSVFGCLRECCIAIQSWHEPANRYISRVGLDDEILLTEEGYDIAFNDPAAG